MARWLVKTEPGAYSFTRMMKEKTTRWDGVTNALALRHLRGMKKGDAVLVYHSGDERSIVGLAEVSTQPYPDPASSDPRRVVVDLMARRPFASPVSLTAIKGTKSLQSFDLVRNSRLSVMPVTDAQWDVLKSLLNDHS